MQEELLRTGHPYSASIKAKGSDLQQLWSEVNEAATERQQALHGAKQVINQCFYPKFVYLTFIFRSINLIMKLTKH